MKKIKDLMLWRPGSLRDSWGEVRFGLHTYWLWRASFGGVSVMPTKLSLFDILANFVLIWQNLEGTGKCHSVRNTPPQVSVNRYIGF